MADVSPPSATRYSTRPVLFLHGAVAVVLFALVAIFGNTDLSLPYREEVRPADYNGPAVLEGWVRYDAGWYRSIADDGYFYLGDEEQSSVAFFPSYPLVMRALNRSLGGDTAVWGILITFLAGVAVSLGMFRWAAPRVGNRIALYSVAVLALWPYAWYLFGAVYADALFVALAIAAFVALEEDRLWIAALCGAAATATRPVGIAVVVGLVVRQLERRGVFSLPRLGPHRADQELRLRQGSGQRSEQRSGQGARRRSERARRIRFVLDPLRSARVAAERLHPGALDRRVRGIRIVSRGAV